MKVDELNRDELTELKRNYYSEKNKNVSYGELSIIDDLVTDAEIYKEYEGTEFTREDFFCNTHNTEIEEEEEL